MTDSAAKPPILYVHVEGFRTEHAAIDVASKDFIRRVVDADAYQALLARADELAAALEWASDWICNHFDVASKWLAEHPDANRHWCGQCHNWVYRSDLDNQATKALTAWRAWRKALEGK